MPRAVSPGWPAGDPSSELFLEEVHRASPRLLGRLLVVAGGVGVVVESVVDVVVDEDLVIDPVLLQGGLELRNAGVDALVEAGVVQNHRRIDLGHLRPEERRGGKEWVSTGSSGRAGVQ